MHVIFNLIPRAQRRSQMCNSIKIGTFSSLCVYVLTYSVSSVANIVFSFPCLRVKNCFSGLRLVANVEINVRCFVFLHFLQCICLCFCFSTLARSTMLPYLILSSLDCVFVTQWIRIYPKERVIVTSTKINLD